MYVLYYSLSFLWAPHLPTYIPNDKMIRWRGWLAILYPRSSAWAERRNTDADRRTRPYPARHAGRRRGDGTALLRRTPGSDRARQADRAGGARRLLVQRPGR